MPQPEGETVQVAADMLIARVLPSSPNRSRVAQLRISTGS
jgi:hypothetical protein